MKSDILKPILTLFKKELVLEVRQQYSFYGILLYMGATIFVLFLAIQDPDEKIWNGLFWVIQLFICINAVAKSFMQESRARMLYFYTISSPAHFMVAKLLFNSLLMLLMTLISLVLFLAFIGNPVQKMLPFIGLSLLGGFSLSMVFTFWRPLRQKPAKTLLLWRFWAFRLLFRNSCCL
ncbi:cytochrome C biogenesis protein [Niabella defluvii]|nr:cytochrome C biogenesis protein [Niabella sp. I65]